VKIRFRLLSLLILSLALVTYTPQGQTASAAPAHEISPGSALTHRGRAALMFIANVGQFDAGALFQVRGAGASMFLAEDALWLTVVDPQLLADANQHAGEQGRPPALARAAGARATPALRGANIRLSFVGANPHPQLEAFDRLDTHLSYFLGDQSRWRADVPVWGGVRYRDLYPGIDLELSGAQGRLEQRLRVGLGANLADVQMRVEGSDGQTIERDYLRIKTAVGDISMPLLRIEQAGALQDAPAGAAPAVDGNDIRAPFAQSAGQASPPAMPSALGVGYATFLGGEFDDFSEDIAVDSIGAAYITGYTFSPGFPHTPGAFDPTCGTDPAGNCDFANDFYFYDSFVAKLNPAGSDLLYATFIGGAQNDYGQGIAVDSSGAAYVAGFTYSSDFFPNAALASDLRTTSAAGSPFAPRATPPARAGSTPSASALDTDDIFAVKLNATGTQLLYNQRLFSEDDNGDPNYDEAYDIAVDANGNAYLAGLVGLTSFDGVVVKLDNAGLLVAKYGGFFGGDNDDWASSIAIDGGSNIYVAGQTQSPNFPTTNGAFDRQCGSDGNCDFDGAFYYYDAFATKVNAAGTGFTYSTFLGGNNGDGGYGIAVDASGAAYITGFTYSSSAFPSTPDAYDSTFGGVDDAFVIKLNPAGSGLAYATFLGTGDADNGRGIAVDSAGSAYVTGLTFSSVFPTSPDGYDVVFNGADDAFVAKLNPAGTQLTYATFLGGDSTDEAFDIALNGSDIVYVSGITSSANLPVSPGAYDQEYAGNTCGVDPNSHSCYDAFVFKLAPVVGPAPQRTRVFLSLAMRVTPVAAPSICDAFEPNDNRRTNPYRLDVGTPYQAGLCVNEEDNYTFDIARNAKPTITVDLPPALRGKTVVWIYDQNKPDATICGYGGQAVIPKITVSNCAVLAPGRYIVRLYSDNSAVDFDKQNPYTLLVTA
jgi:hypothetical protein